MRPAPIRRGWLPIVGVAAAFLAIAMWFLATQESEALRHELVQRRLATAAELLREPSERALTGEESRDELTRRLRELGAVTGLRLTLIDPEGRVLVDSEVLEEMPNLADRPEVIAAATNGSATASRRSVMTGKETIYLALSIVRDGKRLGIIRAAADRRELEETPDGLRQWITILALSAATFGAVAGALATRRSRSSNAAATVRERVEA